MKNGLRWTVCLTGAAACSLLFTTVAMSQQSQDKPAEGARQMSPEEQKAMAAWEAYMTPGEHHKHLAQWVGEWDLKVVMWQAPGMPPSESKATSSAKAMMDGRFVVEKVKGEFSMEEGAPPMQFEGMALMGYDNHKKKYFSHWLDNMGTGCMTEWGTCSGDGKVLTTEGETYNPMAGGVVKTKSVATIVNDNTRKLQMWGPGPDGKMFQSMEITYTRKK